MRAAGISVMFAALVLCSSTAAVAQVQVWESSKLSGPEPAPDARYGSLVVLDGDRAAVWEREAELVHVYEFDGRSWQWSQVLSWGTLRGFGAPMTMDDDWLVVCAPSSHSGGTGSGALRVYEWTGSEYEFRQQLDGQPHESLGEVSLAGDLLVAGASESAVIFRRQGQTFTREQVLDAPYDFPQMGFGRGVATDGVRIVVGAPWVQDLRPDDGVLYVFEHDGVQWAEAHVLRAAEPRYWTYLGEVVDVDGDTIVAGCSSYDSPTTRDTGAAFFFEFDGAQWVEQLYIPADGVSSGNFGVSVDLNGERAAVGALNAEGGSLLRREAGVWREAFKAVAREDSTVVIPGRSVALGDRHLLQGDSWDSEHGERSGAVFAYFVDDLPLNGQAWGSSRREAGLSAVELRPSSPFLLVVTEVDGTPLFHSLGLRVADASGRVDEHWSIPLVLRGLEIRFQGFGIDVITGAARPTNSLPVDL